MKKLKINWHKDILNSLKRANEEVNNEKFIKFRGKYMPKLWVVEYKIGYGNETLFRVPYSMEFSK